MPQIIEPTSRFVSGIRPTGNIHLGNYLGAIKQWKKLQGGNDCVWFVADLHGEHSPDEIGATYEQLEKIGINACIESGNKPEILSIYHQLSFQAPIGWLNRMTQFKDKSQTEDATLALLAYPVLMAADIFHFGGTHIPIGADQKQHIEFVRDLAAKAGYPLPEPIIGEYPRIMSLTDGTKKMSKSEPNDFSRINVTDSPEIIRKKVAVAKTAMNITDDTPEMNNLRTIYKAVGGTQSHARFKDFKEELAELVIKELTCQ